MHRQRAASIAAALVGAATPLLSWWRLSVFPMPLVHHAELAFLVTGWFLGAATLPMIGDRTKPLRSSKLLAGGMTLIGLALVAFVGVFWSQLPQQLALGVGAYLAGAAAALLAVGAWSEFGEVGVSEGR